MAQAPKVSAVSVGDLLLSTVTTAGITAGDAAWQYIQSNGHSFSFVQLISSAFLAFLASLAPAIVTLEKNPTVQASAGQLEQVLSAHLTGLTQIVSSHAAFISQALGVMASLVNQSQTPSTVTSSPPQGGSVIAPPQAPVAVAPVSSPQGVPQLVFPSQAQVSSIASGATWTPPMQSLSYTAPQAAIQQQGQQS